MLALVPTLDVISTTIFILSQSVKAAQSPVLERVRSFSYPEHTHTQKSKVFNGQLQSECSQSLDKVFELHFRFLKAKEF